MSETQTPTRPEQERLAEILPPHAVILHNDDVNEMVHVVRSLRRCVPGLSLERATEIMFEAHNKGLARVVTCPLELAELYCERLRSCKLIATIERA